MKMLLALLVTLFFVGCDKKPDVKPHSVPMATGKKFSYYPAGYLLPAKSGKGRFGDNYVYAPNIRFPIESGEAYINSQVYGIGGYLGAKGSLCNKKN